MEYAGPASGFETIRCEYQEVLIHGRLLESDAFSRLKAPRGPWAATSRGDGTTLGGRALERV